MKLATANEQLLDSVKSINKIGSLEKEIIEIDKLSIHIDEMEDAIKEKLSQIKKVETETAWTEKVSAIWIWIEEHPCITQVWGRENQVENWDEAVSGETWGHKKGVRRFEKEVWTGRHRDESRDTERFEVGGRDVAGTARCTPKGDVGIIETKD